MKPTLEYIKQKFEEYNRVMFDGQLPDIPIEIVNVKGYHGKCSYKTRIGEDGKKKCYDFKLSINERLDVSEEELQDTLIHEMLHYFIGYNQLDDVSAHGPVFLSMMNIINTKFNRNLTVSHKTTIREAEQLVDTQRLWHIIATIETKDGRFGIKVLPKIIVRVIDFVNKLQEDSNISSIELFMSDEPYFNRFPTSSSTKFQFVQQEEVMLNLNNARHIKIHKDDLIEL